MPQSDLIPLHRLSPVTAGGGRSLSYFPGAPTYEPIPQSYLLDYSYADNDSLMARPRVNDTVTPRMSEEALLFLTGPVSTILIPSFYTVVFLISVPINICALMAFSKRIRPKKPAAIYMLNLACADLIFAMLLPFKIVYHFSGNNWLFGPVMCRAVTAAFYWNMYCSVLLIACISVDRLLAVVYPIDSLVWRRPRNSIIACTTMWIVSFAGSVPLVLSEQTLYLKELDITTCHDVLPVQEQIWHNKFYFIALSCTLFFLPLIVTVMSYARVICVLTSVPKGVPGSSRRRTRAVVMALTVVVMFVLCFAPTNCLLLVHFLQFNAGISQAQEAPDGSYAAYLVFLCVGSLNCLLDPVVYYFGSSQCQRQLLSVLTCKKSPESGRDTHSSSRSSSRTILKSSRTESSKINTTDSFQQSLNSQYKKLLV